ncbi:MAG: hypothetical protein EP336_12250 [Rhodobacteraceae bacterium]|nr:MAG: hypothetical protein EP336_12250 [Paracoccaceae bacterium]
MLRRNKDFFNSIGGLQTYKSNQISAEFLASPHPSRVRRGPAGQAPIAFRLHIIPDFSRMGLRLRLAGELDFGDLGRKPDDQVVFV